MLCPAYNKWTLDDEDTVAFVSSDRRFCCGQFCTTPPGVSSTTTPGVLYCTKLEWSGVSLGEKPSESEEHVLSVMITVLSVIWKSGNLLLAWMLIINTAVEGKQQVTPPCLWLNCARLVTWKGWKLPWKMALMSTKRMKLVEQGWCGQCITITIHWLNSS